MSSKNLLEKIGGEISGGGAFLAKAKIASLANDYVKENVVPGGVQTVVGTWVEKFKIVDKAQSERCTDEIVELCSTMENQQVTSINRVGYHHLKANAGLKDIKKAFTDAFGSSQSNEPKNDPT